MDSVVFVRSGVNFEGTIPEMPIMEKLYNNKVNNDPQEIRLNAVKVQDHPHQIKLWGF